MSSKFGNMVREAREKLDISQRALSFMTEISDAEISRIESGVRKGPSLVTITKLCNFFEDRDVDFKLADAVKAVLDDSSKICTDEPVPNFGEEEIVLFEENEDAEDTISENEPCIDPICGYSARYEIDIYVNGEDVPVIVTGSTWSDSGVALRIFDENNRLKACFMIDKIVGYSIRYLED